MPHQCVRCNMFYPDAAQEILKGCGSCGGRFFFYVKKQAVSAVQEFTDSLSPEEKTRIEHDVMEIVGIRNDEPVILDFESINILGAGKFEIDLVKVFKQDPTVYKLQEGKYIIDLGKTFSDLKKEKK